MLSENENDRIKAALAYQARGWRVVQLHGINPKDGLCTCMDRKKPGHERSAGKHPVDGGWQKAAPMTEDEIREAWSGWRQHHNLGIATGAASGFWALDVDPERGGTESLERLQADFGQLPPTVAQRTGSGGFHLLWQMPEGWEPTNAPRGLKPYVGLDVRGTGGQIVAAPSVSAKGPYAWLSEMTAEPEPAPEWLLDLLRPVAPAVEETAAPVAPSGELDERHEAYAARVRELEVGRLVCMRDAATPDGTGYHGEPWNSGVFEVCCALLELANSPWCSYSLDDAKRDVVQNAPRDAGFTADDLGKIWRSAHARVDGKGRPVPVERPDTSAEVASWASAPGVRVDPILLRGATPPPGIAVAVDPEDAPRVPQRSWDDLGNAKRVVDHFGRVLRWVNERESWALYRGGRWEYVKPNVVQGMVQRMLDELVMPTEGAHYSAVPEDPDKPEETERAGFEKWLKSQRMSARIAAAQKEAQGRAELYASVNDFDAHPLLLNTANCIVDLSTGAARPHDPALMLMKQSPVAYDPEAACPGWDRFLARVQPDEQMRGYLQRISGYSVTGDTREQSLFIHEGGGANGKSIWTSTVSAVLGDYGQAVSPAVLLASEQDQHPTGVAGMLGLRWLPASETAPGKRLDEQKVKSLTGGEPISARFMSKDFFEFTPVGKIHLVTNHLPRLSDAPSIWRRIHLIRWRVTIPLEQQDRTLQHRLMAELPGVLAWLVRGAAEWHARGLQVPAQALADVAAYRSDSDVFGDFLRTHTMPAPGAATPTGPLYQAYQSWAFAQGIRKPMSQPSFVETMAERGYERYRTGTSRGFKDIVAVSAQPALPWATAS